MLHGLGATAVFRGACAKGFRRRESSGRRLRGRGALGQGISRQANAISLHLRMCNPQFPPFLFFFFFFCQAVIAASLAYSQLGPCQLKAALRPARKGTLPNKHQLKIGRIRGRRARESNAEAGRGAQNHGRNEAEQTFHESVPRGEKPKPEEHSPFWTAEGDGERHNPGERPPKTA